MTSHAASLPAWRSWFRRNERRIAILWLALVALAMAVLVFPPTRSALLGKLQSASDRWDGRWALRIAQAESLIAAERYEDAARFLERLDRRYPAPSVEHARDAEREHVLRLLAQSYEGMGSGRRTMAAYDRLIAFDPNNYHSVYLKGRAAERMLSGWAIAPEARDAYAAALLIFPNHLGSLRGYIEYYADRGEYLPIRDAYRAYLNAFLLAHLTVTAGDSTVTVTVPADGRSHEIDVDLPRTDASMLRLTLERFPFALDSVSVRPAQRVGDTRPRADIALPASAIARTGMVPAERGAWRPDGDSAAVTIALPSRESGTQRVRLTMRVFKPMNRALWVIVARSFHNLLDDAGRDSAAVRTVLFPEEEEADAALMAPWWATSGLGRALDTP